MRHIGLVAVAFLQASAHVGAFLPPASPTQAVGQRRLSTVAHINLEGIPLEPSAAPALLEPVSSAVMDPTLQLVLDQAVPLATLIVGALVAAEVSKEVPSGWVSEALVEAAPSTLGPKAGRGLYALEDIPEGTVIGSFPGYRLTKRAFATLKSEESQVLSMRYTWRLANGDILDPTDANGQLPDALLGLGGLIRIPTLLALVNEPPPGVDVNLVAVISDKEVLYTAERSIYKGEELFVDYGPDYPRAHYMR